MVAHTSVQMLDEATPDGRRPETDQTKATDDDLEEFVHLAGLTHDDALIAWGGFDFQDPDCDGVGWRIVEDPDLGDVVDHERRATIGVKSRPFGRAESRSPSWPPATSERGPQPDTSNHVGHRAATRHRVPLPRDHRWPPMGGREAERLARWRGRHRPRGD